MEERSVPSAPAEQPVTAAEPADRAPAPRGGPPHLADPRALTILTTEHWSLLTARSLVYNEAFARAGMFLTFLTGSLVALGFVSQASGFNREFLIVAAAVLGFDLLIGLATLGRLVSATAEEFRSLQGMTRLRHAYLEMVPDLARYFSTSAHDDIAGVLDVYGATGRQPFALANLVHGLTTAPGMTGMICSVVGGALAAALLMLADASALVAIGAALLTATVCFISINAAIVRSFAALGRSLEVRFPGPDSRPGAGS